MRVSHRSRTVESAPPDQRRSDYRRVLFSSYLGTTIEFYDFLLYGTAAAVVFPAVFFSGLDPFTAVIFSFGTFAAGYLARPLGGIVFGHFGDRLGRKKMLVITMLVMGVASFLIGLVPSAAAIGGWAAVILVLLRVAQGIAVGGEWGGAALMALEHADGQRRGFAASFGNAGAPTGAVLGSLMLGLFSLLPQEQFLSWGWRVPFLLSVVLLGLGLWVRSQVSESPIFQQALAEADAEERKREPLPLLSVLRRPKALILTTLGAGAAFAFQVTMATFAQSYALAHGATRPQVLLGFAVASFLAIFGVLLAGRLSDRFGRRPVLVVGTVAWSALAFPMFALWGSGNALLITLGFVIGLQLQSLIYGPLGAFISEQFGTKARYTGASLGYQLATLLGGGFTPAILATLARNGGGQITAVAWFLVAMGAVSTIAVLAIREGRHNDQHTVQH
jgi:MFS family permease